MFKLATILCLLYLIQLTQGNATDSKQHASAISPGEAGSGNQMHDNNLWTMVASMRESLKWSRAHNKPMTNANFDWNVNLDQGGRYQLNWRFNYHANKIMLALEIDTSSSNFSVGNDIFALGFSERGQLASSDFCLLWFDLSHRLHLQDARTSSDNLLELISSDKSVCKLIKSRWPTLSEAPDPDAETAAEEEETSSGGDSGGRFNEHKQAKTTNETTDKSGHVFEVVFKRPLEVCHDHGYYTIDNGTTHMVWFTLRGPVLSLDRLNLTELELESSSSQNDGRESRHAGSVGLNFEHGLRRAQLIATKAQTTKAIGNEVGSHSDVRMSKFEVPAVETTYWCKLFKLPEKFESSRFHITSYEAAIEPGNEHVVHHMELFNCHSTSDEQRRQLDELYHSQGGWSGECSGPTRPAATDSCRRVILAWAMGAKPLVYPEQVGQSIGGPEYSPYVMLEVHYNNVGRVGGLVDSSGLRFHYSSQLRPFDAGVLEVGLEYTDKNSIPPNMLTPMAGYCVSECTRAAMSGASGGSVFSMGGTEIVPPDGGIESNNLYHENDDYEDDDREQDDQERGDELDISYNQHQRHRVPLGGHRSRRGRRWAAARTRNHHKQRPSSRRKISVSNNAGAPIYIFAAQMHTHLTGVASWTEVVRAGRLVGELQRDDHYSPHFQEIRLLPRPVRLEPGDALIHYCLYDTRDRLNITLGGHATQDEMCVTYLHYYPKIDLEVCKSSVDGQALAAYFAALASDELQGVQVGAAASKEENYGQMEEGNEGEQANKSEPEPILVPGSVSSNYHSIDWTPRRARELIEFYAMAPLSVQCNRSDGSRWPGNWNGIEPTRLVKWPGERREARDWLERPGARQLIAYRGRGHGKKHARCSRRSPNRPPP